MMQLVWFAVLSSFFGTSSSEAFQLDDIKHVFEEYAKNNTLLYNITHFIEQTVSRIKQDESKLTDCYDSSIGNENFSIFHNPLVDILTTYANTNKNLFTSTDITKRVHNFFTSLHELIHLIIDCMEQPEKKRSQFGLTSRSGLSEQEYTRVQPEYWLSYDYVYDEITDDNDSYGCTKYFDYQYPIPESFDWREQGVVTQVKDQGFDCGSCWIFSAVGSAESAYLIANPNSGAEEANFSEQAVLSCNPIGCHDGGGWMDDAWNIMKEMGIVSANEEPYRARHGVCHKPYKPVAEIKDYCFHKKKVHEEDIQKLIIQNGPTVAAIKSSFDAFKHIKGAFHGECLNRISHAVLIVGWTPEYWIIKNSWGVDWGSQGFLFLDRAITSQCGINYLTGSVWVY